MKKLLIILIVILAFNLLNANDINYKIPQILIIQSYHSGFLWTDNVNNGIKSTLKKYDNNVRIRTEFLDTKRFTSQSFKDNIKRMLEYKYNDSHFDVVMVVDNNAFEIVKELHNTTFKDTPIVFCGLNFFESSQLGDMKNVTGVREKIVSLENFQLIKSLHKNVEKIIVINEKTPTGKQNRLNIEADIREFNEDIEIEIVEDISVADLKEKLRNLSPNTAVLYSLFLKDNQGRFLEYDESIRLVTESANVPVYVSIDFSLGFGAVGGYLSSGTLQGESAANLAIEILKGANADKLKIVDVSLNNYYFDYDALKKWGIKLSSLPADSEIINYEESYITRHRVFIFWFLLIVIVLSSIIFWLIITLIKKNRLKNDLLTSNESLTDLKENLEVLVKERTNELEDEKNFIRTVQDHEDSLVLVFDKNGKLNRANRCAFNNLEFNESAFIGKSIWALFEDNSDVALIQKYIKNTVDEGNLSKQFKLVSNNGRNLIVDGVITSIIAKGESFFILTATNVTEKQYLFEQLAQEEKKYRSVYENSGIAMVTYGENDYVAMVNKKFEELTGYSREEAINKLTWHDLVDPSSVNIIQKNKDLRSQKKIGSAGNYEIKLVNKKGFVIDVLINVVLVPETKEIISTITDITSKNAVQNKMKMLIEEQKAFNDSKNDFYRKLGLDISVPINTIHGILDIVKYSHDSKEIETYLKVLQGLTRQVLYMVNEMTNYQLASSSQELNIQKIALPEFLINSTTLLLSRSNISKIFFSLDEKLNSEEYLAVDSLEKILQILIIKLAMHNPENPITISVKEEDENYLKFVIKRIDSSFETGDYTEVISQRIEEIHKLEYISLFRFNYLVINSLISLLGGKLEVDAENEKSNEYIFTIKKLKKEDVKNHKYLSKYVNSIDKLILPKNMNDKLLLNSESTYPLRVLLVNYNVVDHFALHKILEVLNQKIDICMPEEDLKEFLTKTTYDVIFFDFSIMSINNLDTLKEIRGMNNIYQPFVIATKPYQISDENPDGLELINGLLPEIINIVDIAELIEEATNFKNKKI